MDIQKESNRDYITYGTVVSLMLDYNNTNKIATIPENFDGSMIQDKENNLREYFYLHMVYLINIAFYINLKAIKNLEMAI